MRPDFNADKLLVDVHVPVFYLSRLHFSRRTWRFLRCACFFFAALALTCNSL